MMLRMAWRSVVTRPVRMAVLAAGFGFGVAVMAELLGVGDVMVEQARAPALKGGGDAIVAGQFGSIDSGRFLLWTLLETPALKDRIVATSPSKDASIFLMTARGPVGVSAHGGIPSLEKAVGDPEVLPVSAWVDAIGDRPWLRPDAGSVLRAMDRFHRVPEVPHRASSWAEWLYFNGRTRDGNIRVYLTFLVGPRSSTPGRRVAGVRLQLQHDGHSTNYSVQGDVDEAALLANAPDIQIAGSRVTLRDLRYQIDLNLPGLTGELVLDAAPGRSLPPLTIRGANGWISGYVVPALSGTLRGALQTERGSLTFSDALGYHDHNWGFWEGVSWQWGQVAHEDISIVYGRVFPPADAADRQNIPGFMAVLGPDGPYGFSTDVGINDTQVGRVTVHARSRALDLHLEMTIEETVRTSMPLTKMASAEAMDFLQLGGIFHVTGRIGERRIDFEDRGAAETFRAH